jgi:transcriptional regulator
MTPSSRDATPRVELLQGTLDMLILRAVRQQPLHGYGIAQVIRSGSQDVLQVETGSLYPALHRLERRRLLKSHWGATEHNQRARYYALTAAGRRQLEAEQSRWQLMAEAIARLLGPAETEVSS